jgi:hypothetical protein
MLRKLTHETLGLLDDGRAGLLIDKRLAALVADLEDRGLDEKPRELTIKVILTQTGVDRYATRVEVTSKMPGFVTADHAATMRKQRGEATLNFQEFDQENPKQSRIEDLDQGQE